MRRSRLECLPEKPRTPFNVAAPAIEAKRSSRRFIGMLFLFASVLAVRALQPIRVQIQDKRIRTARSWAPLADCEPGLRAFLHDSEVLPDLRLADYPRIRVARFPRFGLLQPYERIVIFGVVADDHIGAGSICDIQ